MRKLSVSVSILTFGIFAMLTVVTRGRAQEDPDVVVGDPDASYFDPEFTPDGSYMVWFEPSGQRGGVGVILGTMWHCAIDAQTAEFDPPDCRGFAAFETDLWRRAHPGRDAHGVFYVGEDRDGRFVLVRPTGSATGVVTALAAPEARNRRAIYAADRPDLESGLALWLEQIGATAAARHAIQLQLWAADLAKPEEPVLVAEELRTDFIRFGAMDIGFPRWWRGDTSVIWGVSDKGVIRPAERDPFSTTTTAVIHTDDTGDKIDSFPFTHEGKRYLLPGFAGTGASVLYGEDPTTGSFVALEEVVIGDTDLDEPCAAQSHEPFAFEGTLYTTWQVSDCTQSRNFLTNPGEVWVGTLLEPGAHRWRVSRRDGNVNVEPEAYVGADRAWIFYSSTPPGQLNPATSQWQLRRAEVSKP